MGLTINTFRKAVKALSEQEPSEMITLLTAKTYDKVKKAGYSMKYYRRIPQSASYKIDLSKYEKGK